MKLKFIIDYHTAWGEKLVLCGSIPELGENNIDAAPRMKSAGGDTYELEVNVADTTAAFDYCYKVVHENGYVRNEWGTPHKFERGNGVGTYTIYDRWHDVPADKPAYSSAFTDCIDKREGRSAKPVATADTVVLSVSAPTVHPDEVLAVCGESGGVGAWDPKNAVVLSDSEFPVWKVAVPARALAAGSQYKFVILDKASKALRSWEGGNNRVMPAQYAAAGGVTEVNGLRYNDARALYRGAGTAIPVFAIRSEADFGVGDFADVRLMADWAAETGQSFLQLLPINDTTMTGTWTDSYPYNANSCFALHPMYLRLEEMGTLKDAKRRKHYAELGKELNALTQVDYELVNKHKNEYFKEIYAQDGAKTIASAEYKKFYEKNSWWLDNYAAFCVLRDKFGTPDFKEWAEYAEYSEDKVAKLKKEDKDTFNYVCYLQYHLDRQMRGAAEYAHSKGVAIKGDIPIGISRTSVDAWTDTRLFNMDCQAGAPPDDFSVLGQNWGFPTYNWEEMNRDGFAWWKARFRKMSEYFDAYRIDHVLGFFRIWEIPMDCVHGLLGHFNPALPYTPDELRNNYDFWLNVDLQTTPYIMDYFLHDFFGEYTDEARKRFLTDAGYGRYRLRAEFDNQRKVADYFAEQDRVEVADKEKNARLCNALLGLIDDVLFVEDPVEKGKYHPRISAQFTYIYRSLNDYEKSCFDRLYNDFFYRRHNDFWYGKAMWKLPPLIDATDMLCCAEDLGMIPDCVPAVMSQLQILALEIQRMPKDPNSEFGNTWTYPYLSVCTTSTHDMGGIRQNWEEDPGKASDYYHNVLHEAGQAPFYCEPWICRRIIDLHLKSPSMLCIIPLQDYLSMDGDIRREDPREEQINVPANSRHYWRYRMHLTVEKLRECTDFNTMLRDMVVHSGR